MGGRVHRQLFVLFGVSIVGTAVVMGIIFALVTPRASSFRYNVERVQRYVGNRFAEVWSDPAQRSALAEGAARDLEVQVTLQDALGNTLSSHGEACRSWKYTVPIARDGQRLGSAIICVPPRHSRGPATFLLVFGAAAGCLWFFTGLIARRLVRPLDRLVATARAIGDGDLARRSGMHRDQYGEMGVLGETLDDMADRISQQLADQRELLAVVSHEVRSPLARLRVHLELLGERGVAPDTIEKMTAEAVEMDRLVGDLLASARLEFSVVDGRPVDLATLTRAALSRLGLSADLLTVSGVPRAVVDPTLFARALENLLENARLHAGGARGVEISAGASEVRVEVRDEGPGFPKNMAGMAFDSFVRGKRSGGSSLGLGLSLVRRVATAHGGQCWAESQPEGGSVVGFSVRAAGESGEKTGN